MAPSKNIAVQHILDRSRANIHMKKRQKEKEKLKTINLIYLHIQDPGALGRTLVCRCRGSQDPFIFVYLS